MTSKEYNAAVNAKFAEFVKRYGDVFQSIRQVGYDRLEVRKHLWSEYMVLTYAQAAELGWEGLCKPRY